jgi:hypothetical protein
VRARHAIVALALVAATATPAGGAPQPRVTSNCGGLSDGTPCDTACTHHGKCAGGLCAGGAPQADGTPCATGDPCTTDDVCQQGQCMPGLPVTCPYVQCMLGQCIPFVGCVYSDNCDPVVFGDMAGSADASVPPPVDAGVPDLARDAGVDGGSDLAAAPPDAAIDAPLSLPDQGPGPDDLATSPATDGAPTLDLAGPVAAMDGGVDDAGASTGEDLAGPPTEPDAAAPSRDDAGMPPDAGDDGVYLNVRGSGCTATARSPGPTPAAIALALLPLCLLARRRRR